MTRRQTFSPNAVPQVLKNDKADYVAILHQLLRHQQTRRIPEPFLEQLCEVRLIEQLFNLRLQNQETCRFYFLLDIFSAF
jgi:hypothetical protein